MKYQSKPIAPRIIEAILWTGENFDEAEQFIGNECGYQAGWDGHTYLIVSTSIGLLPVAPGEFLVKSTNDYFYVCRDLDDYEPVKE